MAQHFPAQPPGVSSVPTFGGGTDSADLWLMQLKSYFHLAPNLDSNAKKICFASTRMTDQALMWYQSWLGDVEPGDLQSTFDEFSVEFKQRFSPAINVESARMRLLCMTFPSGMSVDDFYSKHFLPALLQTREPDSRDRALLFCQKLPSGMKEAVLFQSPETAADAYQSARLYEFANQGQSSSSVSVSALPPLPSQASIHVTELVEQLEELRASFHAMSSQSPRNRSSYSSRPAPRPAFTASSNSRSGISEEAKQRCMAERRCFNCKRQGHLANACRLPRSDKFPQL
jgi:hypothetical protein